MQARGKNVGIKGNVGKSRQVGMQREGRSVTRSDVGVGKDVERNEENSLKEGIKSSRKGCRQQEEIKTVGRYVGSRRGWVRIFLGGYF